MEGFCDTFDHPHKLVVRGGRDRALGHKVAYGRRGIVETEWKHRRGALCGAFRREGEAVRGLPGRLGSKGEAELAPTLIAVEDDGGERLDGGLRPYQLSSHRDDEI